jgi:nucleotide-binding universal stress UspA family protein
MARHGHRDPLWLFSAVILGPVLAVIAPERIERIPRLLTAEQYGTAATGVRVLVGVDGSPESRSALRAVLDLLAGRLGQLVLAEVVDYDTAEADWRGRQAAAQQHLADAHNTCGEPRVACEVLAGPPAGTLMRFAQQQDVDLIVVGRRGHGLAERLLGSVAEELVRHATVPVLVAASTSSSERKETTAAGGNEPA